MDIIFDSHFAAAPDSMYENINAAYTHSVSSSNLSDKKSAHPLSNNDENMSDDEQVNFLSNISASEFCTSAFN